MYEKEDLIAGRIAEGARAGGVRPGGVLLVHSSLSALGYVPGGAETVIQGLLRVLGPDGTLLLPALSYEHVTAERPIFDVRHTSSNVGAIPEYFRTRAGTRRSVHPTHSVCGIGPLRDALLTDHHLDTTPCGPHSPFHRLPQYDGQILMLGCGLCPNTSMHAIEEIAEAPYVFGRRVTYTVIFADGHKEDIPHRRHGFYRWIQRYDRVADVLKTPDLKRGGILEASVHLIEASALRETVLDILKEDPYYFVEQATKE